MNSKGVYLFYFQKQCFNWLLLLLFSFGDGFSTLTKMIDSVTWFMNKEFQLEAFEKFAKKAEQLGLKSIEKSIQLKMDAVKSNVFWRSRSYYKLQNFLETLTNQIHINIY